MATEAQPEPSATRKPKRHWFQYRITSLLLLTLVCAAGLALFVNPALQQRHAVEFVRSLGGGVRYASDGGAGLVRGPEWFDQSFGRSCFGAVEEVDLRNTQVSDEGLAYFMRLSDLQTLSLNGGRVSDVGLSHLRRLTSLKALSLNNTKISDDGLAHLKRLTELERLYLGNTSVGDAGLEHLHRLTALEWLNLGNTQVSDAGLAHLKGLTALEGLNLSNTRVSNAGVRELQIALPNCMIVH